MKELIEELRELRVEIDARVRGIEAVLPVCEAGIHAATRLREAWMFLGLTVQSIQREELRLAGRTDAEARPWMGPAADMAVLAAVVPGEAREDALARLRGDVHELELRLTDPAGPMLYALQYGVGDWLREARNALAVARCWLAFPVVEACERMGYERPMPGAVVIAGRDEGEGRDDRR